jgi:hypothetical protein
MLVGTIRKDLGATKKETKFMRNGKEVTQTEKPKKKDDPVETFNQEKINAEIQKAATDSLQKENEDLKDQLTVALAASTDDAEKEKATSIIKDLRSQIRLLEIELKEITISRDTYQRENGELKKQVTSLLKKVKKLEV